MTACNPCGAIHSEEANGRCYPDRACLLPDHGLQAVEGSGSEEVTEWHAEKIYFALGLQLDAGKQISRHFDQDVIVRVGADSVPQLILLH